MPIATAALAGHKAIMKLSTSTGGALAKVALLEEYEITGDQPPIDVTSHDSSGDTQIIPGITTWSGSGSMRQAYAQATQKTLFDVLQGETKVDFEFIPTGSSSDGYYSASGYVTNWAHGAPLEDALNVRVNFSFDGALTRTSSST